MSLVATELKFGTLPTYRFSGGDTYISSGLGLGPLMIQNSGGTTVTNWTGPIPVGLIRPFEYSTPIPVVYPWAMNWTPQTDWIFYADNAAAAATRRILMATLNRTNGTFGIQGFILLNYPTATNFTIRDLKMTYHRHISGTAAVQGTNVSGYSTDWTGEGVCVGNRIGFGTTEPSGVGTWYEIATIPTTTGITLTGPYVGANFFSGSYIIEDLRAITYTTNATAGNGGVFVTKGLRPELFAPGGNTINTGITTDNIRATYWIQDAPVVTNTAAIGCDLEPSVGFTGQTLWALDTVATPKLFKYNIRAPLVLTGAKAINAFYWSTNTGGTPAGTVSQVANATLAIANSGPGAATNCLYFSTTTRIYRTSDVTTLTSGSNSWLIDNMSEVPAGGTNTFAASSLMNTIKYSTLINKFIVPVNATTTPFKSYATAYQTAGSQFDRNWGIDTRQIDQSTADGGTTPLISTTSAPYTCFSQSGILYIATIGTTAILNRAYALPFDADWEYASSTNCQIVTPAIPTPNCNNFIRAYISEMEILGGTTVHNLGLGPEPYRVYYRTTGITDNSGAWTLLDDYKDLSGIGGATQIQFMFQFRTIGTINIPGRIISMTVLYQDNSTLSNYQPSVGNSSLTSKLFAWRFATAFGTTVPTLYVRLYDAIAGSLLVTDNTASPVGTFQKSTDNGVNWGAYNSTDLGVSTTTYIRYLPASLGDNINVSAILTLS